MIPAKLPAYGEQLNCRAGDLAIVIRGPYLGKLVDVLRPATVGSPYRLLNGVMSTVPPGRWYVTILGSPIPTIDWNGNRFLSRYGVAKDTSLRPLRGGELDDANHRAEPFTVS